MAMTPPPAGADERWNDIRDIHKRFADFYRILGGTTIVGLLLFVGAMVFIEQQTDFFMNAFTEFASIIATVLILDRIYQRREREARKRELILQMGSPDNGFAREAVRCLRHEGWLYGNSLKKISFFQANLANTILTNVNFSDSNLMAVNLENSILVNANLEGADLGGANLTDCLLAGTNLSNTTWRVVINPGEKVITAIMPDGEFWTPETDLNRFTNPEHPDFWEPST